MAASEFLIEKTRTGDLRIGLEDMVLERLGQRVQRSADVADDPDVDRIVRVDLGREAMDVDDLLISERCISGTDT